MTGLRIRQARTQDRPAMAALMVASWRHVYAGDLPREVLEELPERFARKWQTHASGPGDLVMLAEDDRGICGLAAFLAGDPLWLDNLHVAPDRHGQGIGRRLLAGCVAPLQARGVRAVELTVLRDNAPARAFYARMGGQVVAGETADLLGSPVPVLRLRWDDIAHWAGTGHGDVT